MKGSPRIPATQRMVDRRTAPPRGAPKTPPTKNRGIVNYPPRRETVAEDPDRHNQGADQSGDRAFPRRRHPVRPHQVVG